MVAAPQNDTAYSGSSITVLEGLEAVRKRPGMYIGSTGERGLHHLVWEVVDNAVDEAMAGYCDTVEVTLLADGGVRVEDNGRGIPVDMHPVEKRPTVEVVLTILHAGGKFDGKSYARLRWPARRRRLRGQRAVHRARRGHLDATAPSGTSTTPRPSPAQLDEVRPDRQATGTAITFWADPTIFETTTYNFETISRRLQEMAFLNKGLTIVLRDERPGQGKADTGLAEETSIVEEAPAPGHEDEAFEPTEVTYRYDGGLVDYVTYINRRKSPIHRSVIGFSADGVGKNDTAMSLEVAMQWSDAYSESVHTFANTINTHEGGTHEEGFRAALTSIVNRYARGQEAAQGQGRRRCPATTSARAWPRSCRSRSRSPQFEGQTKTKLGNTEVKSFVQQVCNERLGHWFEGNPAEAKDDRHQGRLGRAGPPAPRRGPRAGAPQEPAVDVGGLPGKLADCRSTDPAQLRGLHRRGRLGRRLGQVRPRLDVPGDPAASAARSSTSRRRASTGC